MQRALMWLNLYDSEAVRHKLKTGFFEFLGRFWAISMPVASFNPTNPKTNPWSFHKIILRIGDFEKWPFFESTILNIFFCFIPMKISHKLCIRMDGTQFLWLWWFTAKNHSPQRYQPAVYTLYCIIILAGKRDHHINCVPSIFFELKIFELWVGEFVKSEFFGPNFHGLISM